MFSTLRDILTKSLSVSTMYNIIFFFFSRIWCAKENIIFSSWFFSIHPFKPNLVICRNHVLIVSTIKCNLAFIMHVYFKLFLGLIPRGERDKERERIFNIFSRSWLSLYFTLFELKRFGFILFKPLNGQTFTRFSHCSTQRNAKKKKKK